MIDDCDPLGLLALLPPLRRCRGHRLYAVDGKRFLDFWQFGGRAILGHTPRAVPLALKDAASRGFSGLFPSVHGPRLEKALAALVPGYPAARVYPDAAALGRAAEAAGFDPRSFLDAPDPALGDPAPGLPCALWRPWAPVPDSAVLKPVLPFPWPGSPVALLMPADLAGRFPGTPPLSPLLCAAACSALAVLRDELAERDASAFGRFDKALETSGAALRRGPYLSFAAAADPEAYSGLFRRALAAGILLPPDPCLPALLPPDLSSGEAASFAAVLGG